MKRNIFATALSVLLLGGPAAVAQDKPTDLEKTDQKTVKTTAGTTKSKTHTIVGTVKEYEAGKELKVVVGKKTHSFSLDAKDVNTSVDPAVAVGSRVKIVESKNAEGIKTITVNPAS